jgi:hypothetical protein
MAGGQEISLFSGYNQKENRHTNYCLLLLKQLYEENPRFLAEALDGITGGEGDSVIGVQFRQQQKHGRTIPDGVIKQQAFTLFVETKNFDWFYDNQLERHLDALNDEHEGQKVLLALSKFEDGYDDEFEEIERLCREKYGGEVVFSALSFEEFLEAVRIDGLSKNLEDTVDELETYMDTENLLPDWKHMLDVCNCASNIEEQYDHNVYICPATGGSYSHKRCRYFGAYNDKHAQVVSEILGVVELDSKNPDEATVQWNNSDELSDESLIEEAIKRKYASRPNRTENARVFVLGELHDTRLKKDSKGGMINSKRYFDVEDFGAANAAQLAGALDGVGWSELE